MDGVDPESEEKSIALAQSIINGRPYSTDNFEQKLLALEGIGSDDSEKADIAKKVMHSFFADPKLNINECTIDDLQKLDGVDAEGGDGPRR